MTIEFGTISLQLANPTFEILSSHVAHVIITNQATVQTSYDLELYIGANKSSTTGLGTVIFLADETKQVDFNINMPAAEGTYNVYLDAYYQGALFAHRQATQQIIVEFTPDIEIGDITWS